MSCYEWEHGEVVIPTRAWAKFRTGLLRKWNAQREKLLAQAQEAYPVVKAALKGQDLTFEAVHTAAEKWAKAQRIAYDEHGYDVPYALSKLMIHCTDKGLALRKPTKKSAGLVAVSKGCVIAMPYADAHFSNERHSVAWDVPENNRAKEAAHAHPFAGELFRALAAITWTADSGGTILSNDEYNRESGEDCEGGGGSYATFRFSKAEQEAEKKRKASRSYRPLSYTPQWRGR